MRRTIGLLTLLALAVFGAACTTAENSNSNANSNAKVMASPSPSASPANSNANAQDNMNMGNMNMANMNMGNHNKKAKAGKTPYLDVHLSRLGCRAGLREGSGDYSRGQRS